MRAKFYILIITLVAASSCNTIEKMVDQGRYNEAFSLSVKKLSGKKNKKAKYVVALEEAYIRLNERDLNEISFLMRKEAPASWDRVVHLYENIEMRQSLVQSISPLVAKNGYVAHFTINDYSDNIIEAMELSANYHYNKSMEHVARARAGDKRSARRAMTSLNEISKYYKDYKDINELKEEMHTIGTTYISIEIINSGDRFFEEQSMDHLYSMNISNFNSFWEKFERYNPAKNYDDYVVIELSNIHLGSEREYVHRSSFEKEIEDGFDIVKETIKVKIEEDKKLVTSKGDDQIEENKTKDKYITKVKTTKIPKYRTVYADIIEIKREKLGDLTGKLKIYRNGDETPYYQKTINTGFDFYDEAVRFNGDRRALPIDQCNRLNDYINDFPSDFEMVDKLACGFRDAVAYEINNYSFIYN